MFSQNGALVIVGPDGRPNYASPDIVRHDIPGTSGIEYIPGLLRGDVETVLLYVGAFWNRFIEPVTDFWNGKTWEPQNWGYHVRTVRGQENLVQTPQTTSNHSSATASDTNSGLHPLGTETLTPKQKATLAGLAADLRGVVRFGAFYTGRKDEMHSEVVVFGDKLRALADDIRRGRMDVNFPELVTNPDPVAKPATPKPAPYVSKEDDEMVRFYKVADRWFVIDHAAGTVREIRDENELRVMTGEKYGGITPDETHNKDANLFALITQSLTSTKGPWRAA